MASSLAAQDYIPMAVDSATWVLSSTDENPIFDEFLVLRIEGDTIVNSNTYSKIYRYHLGRTELRVNSRLLIGMIRDDIDARKVYGGIFKEQEDGLRTFLNEDMRCSWGTSNSFAEHLLYDFSLQEGDSLDLCMLTKPAVISSIEYRNEYGYERLRYEIGDEVYITEGIGTCIGIFNGQTCFYTGGGFSYGLSNYCIGSFENCGLLTSLEEQITELNDLSISPNPVTSSLRISSSQKLNIVSLFDFNGRLLKSITNADEISMIEFEQGIYILRIEDELGNQNSFRVIKL